MPVLTRNPVRKKRDPRSELAREFLKGTGIQIEGVEDIAPLRTIEDGTQDYVSACQVLESCSNVLAGIHAMHRVLRPGGVLFLSVADMRHTEARDHPVTPLGHLAADYVHGPDQADGLRQHVWTPLAWMELILAVQAGLGMELEAVRTTRQEIVTVLRK